MRSRGLSRTVIMHHRAFIYAFLASLTILGIEANAGKPASREETLEFFERKIRPIFAAHCWNCHTADAGAKGGLDLGSREKALMGGDRGAAILPGRPADSFLITAVRRLDNLEMPPDHALTSEQVQSFEQWIENGAAWPDERVGDAKDSPWSLKPVVDYLPPNVHDQDWPRTPVDRFVLAKLEENGLRPAPPADRRTLLRRAYFDLIGLPPTPEQIRAFLEDDAPDAFAKVVDELLANPAYGERWGRHWLDLVRFAETNGFEYDTPKPHAFQYRDYVIEAFNEDLPYDQFLREFLAGDLLPRQRLSADGKRLASAIGTHALWFQEILQFPVDWPLARAEEVENQIDVLCKSTLGLTVACARCHDHKFDPISTADYYSLAGSLMSTECVVRCVDSSAVVQESESILVNIRAVDDKIQALRAKALHSASSANHRLHEARLISRYLLATRELVAVGAGEDAARIEQAAARHGISAVKLRQWLARLTQGAENDSIFRPWLELSKCADDVFDYRRQAMARRCLQANSRPPFLFRRPYRVLADFEGDDFGDWTVEGRAFGSGPEKYPPVGTVGMIGHGVASSYRGTSGGTGRLTSPKFPLVGPVNLLAFRIAGGAHAGKTCVNLIVNDQSLVYELTHSVTGENNLAFRDVFLPLAPAISLTKGVTLSVDIVDESEEEWGFILVDDIRLIDGLSEHELRDEKLDFTNPIIASMLSELAPMSPARCAKAHQEAILAALLAWQIEVDAIAAFGRDAPPWSETLFNLANVLSDTGQRELAHWALRDDSLLLDQTEGEMHLSDADRAQLASLRDEKSAWEKRLPSSSFAMTCKDSDPRDVEIQKKGNPHTLGSTVPRGYLQALRKAESPPATGSGRLQIADWIASNDNPLTARVFVNRIWQHYFGNGIVRTLDDFGTRGEPPTHPELLDYLASTFMNGGWSIKSMHRLIVLSSLYQQSSSCSDTATSLDPDNRWLHHMPPRRLDAECIRDSMLFISRRLDGTMFGPSVPVAFPTKPSQPQPSPLAGNDARPRRSIYLAVQRNVADPFLSAFDFPKPTTCIGKRSNPLVASQSLFLLNNIFVRQQAAHWGDAIADTRFSDDDRVRAMFVQAFARTPTDAELTAGLSFVHNQTTHFRMSFDEKMSSRNAWRDFAHVLFNLPEFLFVQ